MMLLPRQANGTTPVVYGWTPSPNGRGTIDIIQLCLATVGLCTYSVLFLNINQGPTRFSRIIYKTKWVAFTIFFPEMTTAMAAEQWRSARESVADFLELRKSLESKQKVTASSTKSNRLKITLRRMQEIPWTARHAFFADMGGLRLKCPDFLEFPINTVHLLWLVQNGHVEYPQLEETTIKDKNKADTLSRGITVLQVTWFLVQFIARGIQHLSITTLELSTLAFVCCTIHSYWFWWDKPLDVNEPIILRCEQDVRSIVPGKRTSSGPKLEFIRTPLDFLDLEARTSYVEPFFYGMMVAMNQHGRAQRHPVTSLSNSAISHKGIKVVDIVYGYVFGTLYFGIHLAAWEFHFPSLVESWLWRSCSIMLALFCTGYELACWPGSKVGKYFLPGRPSTAIEIGRALPQRLIRVCMWPFLVISFCARTYIIVEGFVGLRALPATSFQSVNWWTFVPHL